MSASNTIIEKEMQITGKNKKSIPLLNNLLVMFMIAMVLANISGNMYTPLLPVYLKELNASVAQIGLFFTLSQIVPLVLQILGGWISDNLGRLRSIALGSIAGFVSYIGLILSPSWQWVLLGEGLAAVTRSLVAPSFNAFIAEQSSEHNRGRVFGIAETIFMVVLVIGPPFGGFLANMFGFKSMLLCAALIYLIATWIRVRMARYAALGTEAFPQKLSLYSLRKNLGSMIGLIITGGLVTWILISDGIRDIAYAFSFNLYPIYVQEFGGLNIQQIGFLEAVFGVCMMITSMPAGLIADKRGERFGIAIGFIIQFIALMVFIRVLDFWGFAFAWALLGIGIGMMSPAYNSLISKAVPEKLRGTAFGLFSTSLGIISLPAPAIGAQLWENIGPTFPFMITAWLGLLVIVPVWFKFRLSPNKNHQS